MALKGNFTDDSRGLQVTNGYARIDSVLIGARKIPNDVLDGDGNIVGVELIDGRDVRIRVHIYASQDAFMEGKEPIDKREIVKPIDDFATVLDVAYNILKTGADFSSMENVL